ncbi:MAG: hypothetical protein A2V77_08895 [Anaeromyxobacter sp. RBG_16_69_14]|nr:MAG: hypothetical protein A2V77_08895 [Anaeromyxobacter sp. RBG_16_69_14]
MADQGVVKTTVTWAANLTEKAMGVPLGAARTIRDEAFRAASAGVDWAEGINQASFRVAREMLQRMDKLSRDAVDGLESAAGAASRSIRGSGEGEAVAAGTKDSSQASQVVAA